MNISDLTYIFHTELDNTIFRLKKKLLKKNTYAGYCFWVKKCIAIFGLKTSLKNEKLSKVLLKALLNSPYRNMFRFY